jgi:demethylmenaquinone methyltransferase/2-methoxy-6-polyprenyl-1,4-benzoquinol methylase
VYDARMLVNLAAPRQGEVFLDPFAGIGGIVREAAAGGCGITLSTDIDPALRHGLRAMSGNRHAVADASRLPFGNATVDAVATEPPYHAEATAAVHGALREMRRVLRPGGRLAVLCAASQADGLRAEAAAAGGLEGFLDAPVNRKGLDVVVLAWRKAGGP